LSLHDSTLLFEKQTKNIDLNIKSHTIYIQV